MMLLEKVIDKLQEAFPTLHFTIDEDRRQIMIPGGHPGFGAVQIQDDESELTIHVGRFTHSHTSPQEDDLTEEEKAESITWEVINFLQDLFDDQIVVWGSHEESGGFYHKDAPLNLKRSIKKGVLKWVWSGPVPNK